jgi:hypothetical protein
MRIFDDFHETKAAFNNKEEHISELVKLINDLHEGNRIKDIMLIIRTTDTEPAPKGLPQNVINAVTVDTEYETNVFMRFATDILFEKARKIAIKDYLRSA